ncbi:DUF6456 domain-containing protein [Fluviibacterium sp. DFM31]|uniref:DUF6456 domain-containing protein n=1 Tax=Meridianimarinicoccus marinus TaxID=3231483 RepID=A0ABV3L535_9RHOB
MTNQAIVTSEPISAVWWLPEAAIHYVVHTELGRSIRAIARDTGYQPSTVMRRVRRFENRREDPLVDGAFNRLSGLPFDHQNQDHSPEETRTMTATIQAQFSPVCRQDLSREAKRVLRRLAESGAVLAFAQDMEKAVVVRDLPGGDTTRTAVVDREVAEVMALNDWIRISGKGRISKYTITGVGRAALKRMLADASDATGMREDTDPFAGQHRHMAPVCASPSGRRRRPCYNLSESPLSALARRKDKSGQPFLTDDLVAAGERLREDFEMSQMGPNVAQNWATYLNGPQSGLAGSPGGGNATAESARGRVMAALEELGAGLGDVVLRCCCFLEGIETTEKSMGWSARSGKVVLRIALQRLKRHYDEQGAMANRLIG